MTTTPQNTDTFSSNIDEIARCVASHFTASEGLIDSYKDRYVKNLTAYANNHQEFKTLCSKDGIAKYYKKYKSLVTNAQGYDRERVDSFIFDTFESLLKDLGCEEERPDIIQVIETVEIYKGNTPEEREKATYLAVQIPEYVNSLLYLSWIDGALCCTPDSSNEFYAEETGVQAFIDFLFDNTGLREMVKQHDNGHLKSSLAYIKAQLNSNKQKIILCSNDLSLIFIARFLRKTIGFENLNLFKPCKNGGVNAIPAFTLDDAFTKKKEGV